MVLSICYFCFGVISHILVAIDFIASRRHHVATGVSVCSIILLRILSQDRFASKGLFDIIYFFDSRINFEFPATGGILTEATFDTAKLLRYLSRKDYVVLGG